MNHFTDRQRQAEISAGDEQTCRVVHLPRSLICGWKLQVRLSQWRNQNTKINCRLAFCVSQSGIVTAGKKVGIAIKGVRIFRRIQSIFIDIHFKVIIFYEF